MSRFRFNLSYKSFLYNCFFLLKNLSKIRKPSLIPAFFFKVLKQSFFGLISKNFCTISIAFIILLFLCKISKASFFNVLSLSVFALYIISVNFWIKFSKLFCLIFFDISFHLSKYSFNKFLLLVLSI